MARLIQALAGNGLVFDVLRWLLEGGYAAHRRTFARAFKPCGGTVLDIGCGTGTFARSFAPDQYLGVDLNPVYVDRARRKHPDFQFAVADARRLPLAAGMVDRVLICGLLHHLSPDDAHAVIAEVRRVLKPDGVLVVSEDVPIRRWWNVIGKVVQRLDLGAWIREGDEYRKLLTTDFVVRSEHRYSSGLMEYAVFQCQRRMATNAENPASPGLAIPSGDAP